MCVIMDAQICNKAVQICLERFLLIESAISVRESTIPISVAYIKITRSL